MAVGLHSSHYDVTHVCTLCFSEAACIHIHVYACKLLSNRSVCVCLVCYILS